jgi:endonuclease III
MYSRSSTTQGPHLQHVAVTVDSHIAEVARRLEAAKTCNMQQNNVNANLRQRASPAARRCRCTRPR